MRELIRSDMDVLRLLHKGQAHKTNRKRLIEATGLSERAVYDSIEALRTAGINSDLLNAATDPFWWQELSSQLSDDGTNIRLKNTL